jgi:hypothetical protein
MIVGTQPSLHAQLTAQITGTITDQSGAVVPGAKITIVNVSTNIAWHATSNQNGFYSVPLLQPGAYRIDINAAGFRSISRSGITLQVAQTATLNFALEVGSASQTITVSGAATLLDTSSNAIGGLITPAKVENVPLLGRNSAALMELVPAVRATSGVIDQPALESHYEFFSVNGSRPNQSQFLVNGGNDTDLAFNGPEYSPQVEEVQEYRIQTSDFSAEYGNASGGVINIVTKSGTNDFHGDLFEYFRNNVLAANDFFSNRAGIPIQALRYNQFGGAGGGPIKKNRAFLFFAYEGLREVIPIQTTTSVPTPLQRAGDFSQTLNSSGQAITIYDPSTTKPDPNHTGQYLRSPFLGNKIPNIDPVAAKIETYYPAANQPGLPNTGLNNYFSNLPSDRNTDNFSGRVDDQLNSHTALTAMFSRSNVNYYYTPPVFGFKDIGSPGYSPQPQHHIYALGKADETFSPTLFGDFAVSWARWFYNVFGLSNGFDPTQLGFPSYVATQSALSAFPSISQSEMSNLGGASLSQYVADRYEYSANLSKQLNKHTLKFGGLWGLGFYHDVGQGASTYAFSPAFTQGPNPVVSSAAAGFGYASFLLGTMASGSIPTGDTASGHYKMPYYGIYVQDEYRLTKSLTLNVGLRWEYESPRTEAQNQVSNFDLTDTASLSNGTTVTGGLLFPSVGSTPRGSWNANTKDFAPRFGFAYNLKDKTVFRGGYGIFYSNSWGDGQNHNAMPQNGFFCTTPVATSLNNGLTPYAVLSSPFPTGFCTATGSKAGLLTNLGTQLYILSRAAPQPYAQTWNFDIQRTFLGNTVGEVAYSGSRGIHLPGYQEYDQLSPQNMALGNQLNNPVPNPFYGVITQGSLSGPTIPLGQSLRPYPQFLGVQSTNADFGNSIYHALQVTVDRPLSHGLNIMAAYTLSKEIDDTVPSINGFAGESAGGGNPTSGTEFAAGTLQNYYSHRAERALASWDTPQSLVISYIYELPFGPGKPIVNGRGPLGIALGGWQVNGITTFQRGMPLQVNGGNNNGSFAGLGRPNWNGQNPTLGGPWENRLSKAFNTSDFSYNAPFTFGTAPRVMPDLRAQGLSNFDMSLFKNDNIIGDRLKVQFRAEFFNTFNHVQFGSPNVNINSTSFGVISGPQQNLPRQIQLALRLLF